MLILTGVTGRYGRLVAEALLARGTPPGNIAAIARDPADLAELSARGMQVRHGDYDRPETLRRAFKGATTLLLVPTSAIGRRFSQMQNAVLAAVEEGVERIAYAGFLNSDHSSIILGAEHRQTEALIRRSRIRYIFLRNGPYIEPFAGELGDISDILAKGELSNPAGNGRFSGVCREDLAEAAAKVITDDILGDVSYELGGTAFTMADLASVFAVIAQRSVVYKCVSSEEYSASLGRAGYDKTVADIAAEAIFSATRGDWYTTSRDLQMLLGRPSTPLIEVVAKSMKFVAKDVIRHKL